MLPEPKSKEWHQARRSGIGGSDANIIMGGDPQKIHELWEIKTGRREPDDLSDVFRVQLGSYTEPLNLAWFAKKTGLTITTGRRAQSERHGFMYATLDGETVSAVIEAKHVGGHQKMSDVLARYQPQLHHNMICTGYIKAYLSVIIGNEWDYVEVDYDPVYAQALLAAETEFWECVRLDMAPGDTAQVVAPPEATRSIDMTGNNEWASLASEWLNSQSYAKQFDKAADGLKKLVAADVRAASGHGIKITRDKRRYLKIAAEG